jgi:hypothetical protein
MPFRRLLILGMLVLCVSCTRPSRKKLAAAAQADVKPDTAVASYNAATRKDPKVFTLPAGTRFSVRIPKSISSQRNLAGSTVEGELAAPIAAFAETIAPRGARVTAVVADAINDERTGSRISLRATRIDLKGGKAYHILSDEPEFHAAAPRSAAEIPAESLIAFRLKTPVQVTVD